MSNADILIPVVFSDIVGYYGCGEFRILKPAAAADRDISTDDGCAPRCSISNNQVVRLGDNTLTDNKATLHDINGSWYIKRYGQSPNETNELEPLAPGSFVAIID